MASSLKQDRHQGCHPTHSSAGSLEASSLNEKTGMQVTVDFIENYRRDFNKDFRREVQATYWKPVRHLQRHLQCSSVLQSSRPLAAHEVVIAVAECNRGSCAASTTARCVAARGLYAHAIAAAAKRAGHRSRGARSAALRRTVWATKLLIFGVVS